VRYLFAPKVFLLFCFTIMLIIRKCLRRVLGFGRVGLFITPWFPKFDPTLYQSLEYQFGSALKSPLHLWHLTILRILGTLWESYIKTDIDRDTLGLSTYAHICVEIDLSKGLLNKLILKWENFRWTQVLDYENTILVPLDLSTSRTSIGYLSPCMSSSSKEKRAQAKEKDGNFPSKNNDDDQEEELQQTSDSEKVNTTSLEVSNEGKNSPMETREEAKHIDNSPSGMEVVKDATSGGIKRAHKSENLTLMSRYL
jgi:hypothetical protein